MSGKILKDKRALITGSSRGIGKQIAIEMAKEGAIIGVNATKLENTQSTIKEIENLGGIAYAVPGNLSDPVNCRKVVEDFSSKAGGIDILVNNAGINFTAPIEKLDLRSWDELMAVNLRAAYLCSKYAIPYMKKKRWGRIINLASLLSFIGLPERAAYAASKAGVLGLTRVLALELAPYNVTVNAIAPGFIETEMVRARIREGKLNAERLTRRIPMRRMGTPKDVARAVVFLASDDAAYMTGQVIIIDGGYLAQGAP